MLKITNIVEIDSELRDETKNEKSEAVCPKTENTVSFEEVFHRELNRESNN